MACFAFPTASRCSRRCIATYRPLRRDVAGAASPRSFGGIGRTVTSSMWVSWLIGGKAKM